MRFLCAIIGAIAFAPTLLFAQTQSASIITRTGNITPPLKYHFDLASSLTEGVNQGVCVAVSASNPEKTAIRFDSVRLFSKDGSPLGNNVASKTDALTPNPYSFIFQNFGIAPKDLVNVAGVQITFMDMGGENPTGKILVHGITVSVIRDTGESCIEIDPITITTPEKPRVTINQIQAARPLVQPGTHGDGGSGSSGGGTDTGFTNPGSASAGFLSGDVPWSGVSNILTSNDANATVSLAPNQTVQALYAYNFGFSVPGGATVNGVTVTVERAGGTNMFDGDVQLTTDGGTVAGSNMAQGTWIVSESVVSYGGASNTWGLTPGSDITPTIVNSSAFGFILSAYAGPGVGVTGAIDNIQMKITYTTGGGSVYDSFMDLLRALLKNLY